MSLHERWQDEAKDSIFTCTANTVEDVEMLKMVFGRVIIKNSEGIVIYDFRDDMEENL